MTIKRAHGNALRGIRNSDKKNERWVPSMEPEIKDNTLVVRASRKFDQPDENRIFSNNKDGDFKLRTRKTWFVGFFDLGANVGATSDMMKLTLDSGWTN